ncbi:hypothetical protein BD626DRAFT_475332 [Schizophyllum amplum]|uniref:Uncharacterized protein n=1 Tax=Schizophyllum amplum TaxID=97359 RepID=A0A550CYE3_9AGAR|nr:hypothetical protein BD626DRAFT_475332 [Auriculariopsis ampla]
MGILGYFSSSKVNLVKPDDERVKPEQAALARSTDIAESSEEESDERASEHSPLVIHAELPAETHGEGTKASSPIVTNASKRARRFSLKTMSFTPSHKAALTADEEHEMRADATDALERRLVKRAHPSAADRRARESAHIVRALIVGPDTTTLSPKVTKAVARPQLGKVKSQLMKPKDANRVIAQLRALSSVDEVEGPSSAEHSCSGKGPIHAVCLAYNEAMEQELHFSKLEREDEPPTDLPSPPVLAASRAATKLRDVIDEMHIVDLLLTPDLGVGQPADGKGLLAGSVPTAETVINGVTQITPQLMALGYATGRAILPDHAGVYPPTDRLSVLTYWWGLELCLPPPTLSYLASAHSINGQLINFLTAMSLVNNGVKEILPFVRYMSQFIDFEFNTITKQNKGHGVVCAATWIMPAALVPRPWDFAEKPTDKPYLEHPPPIPEEPESEVTVPTVPQPSPVLSTPVVGTSPTPGAPSSPMPAEPASPITPVTIAPVSVSPSLVSQVIAAQDEQPALPSPATVLATA